MNLTNKLTQGSSLTALAFISAIAPAQTQDPTSEETYKLDDFTTVSSRIELPLDRVGSSVEVITSYDLELTNQSFVLDAIRTVPGFNLRNNGGPGNSFGITTRGLNSYAPLVLIDGIEVSNPQSGRIINFGNLFGSNISRIEILKGPQSSLYGADAVAGVISIQTLNGNENPGGSVEISTGSFETYEGNIGYRGSAGAFNFAVNLNHYTSDGFSVQRPSYGAAWADDDAYDNTTFATKVDFQATESLLFHAIAYYNESYTEFDPGDPRFAPENPTPDNYTDTEQTFANLGAKATLSENWDSQLDLTYGNVDSTTNSSWSSSNEGDRLKADWKNTITANANWYIVTGAEFERTEDTIKNYERDDKSIYVENILNLSSALDWTIGLRYDDNEESGSETTYRTTFSYQIDSINSRLHGSYGTSFKAPTFYQLNSFYGNKNLDAESGEGWDFGIETSFADKQIALSSTLFGYDITDKIQWANTGYFNEGRYQSNGIENAAHWYLNDEINLKLAYTYVSADYGNDIEAERVPRNTYSLTGNWDVLDDKLNLNATILHTGSQYSLKGNTEKQDAYTVVNLAASYALSESSSLWVRADNVFNIGYEEIAGYQTPGAAYYAGLRLDF